jgi:hypothetical protein
LVVVAPLVLLGLLLVAPARDLAWENHPAHFWLVLTTAMVCVGLGAAVGAAARRRRDSRTVLIALACTTAAGFLGLHALATPGVLLDPAPVSNRDTRRPRDGGRSRRSPPWSSGRRLRIDHRAFRMAAGVDGDGNGSVGGCFPAELPPLDRALSPDEVDGWQVRWSYPGGGYVTAAAGYAGCIAAAERRFR